MGENLPLRFLPESTYACLVLELEQKEPLEPGMLAQISWGKMKTLRNQVYNFI